MFADGREKKMLAQRNKDAPDPDVQSYEDYKKKQDEESYLGSGIAGETLEKVGGGVSKVADTIKDLWYEVSTPRWKKEERKKKGM